MQQDERVEAALWVAVRALEERANLRRRMASQTEAAGLTAVSEAFAEQAAAASEQADQVRELLTNSGKSTTRHRAEVRSLAPHRKRPRQG